MDDAISHKTGVGINPIELLKESVRPVVSGVSRRIVGFEHDCQGCNSDTPEQRLYLPVESRSINQRGLTLSSLFEYGPPDPSRRVIENSRALKLAKEAQRRELIEIATERS